MAPDGIRMGLAMEDDLLPKESEELNTFPRKTEASHNLALENNVGMTSGLHLAYGNNIKDRISILNMRSLC